MSAELNRRIAEATGYRMALNEDGWWELFSPDENATMPVWSVEGIYMTPEDAWDGAIESGALPDYSGDPSAALALLEKSGTHWSCSTLFSGGYEVEVYGVEGEDALHCAEAATFAEAAARAWVQWKEAGDE